MIEYGDGIFGMKFASRLICLTHDVEISVTLIHGTGSNEVKDAESHLSQFSVQNAGQLKRLTSM